MSLKLISIGKSLVFCLGAASLWVHAQTADDKKRSIDVRSSYCVLPVTDFWKRANSSFYLMYSFKIDSDGNVLGLKKIRDDVVGLEHASKCVQNWKFSGLPEGSNFIVNFRWQHGKGWVEQAIHGKRFKQITTMENIGY